VVEKVKSFFRNFITDTKQGNEAWKFRRKLIFGSYRIAIFVVLVSLVIAILMPQLQDLAIETIKSMVGMLSIIVSAYVGGAIVDDRLNKKKEDQEP